jgi:hypothetical protein
MQDVNRVSRLYAALTNKERAILVFNHVVTGDKEEVRRIVASVPMKNYRGPDLEYERFYNGIWDAARAYETESWYLAAMASRNLFSWFYFDKHGDAGRAENALQTFFEYSEKTQILEAALEALCDEQGFDLSVMRKFSNTDAEIRFQSPELDQEAVEKYKAKLSRAGGFFYE